MPMPAVAIIACSTTECLNGIPLLFDQFTPSTSATPSHEAGELPPTAATMIDATDNTPGDEPTPAPKKKRGRPPKKKPEDINDDTADAPAPKKRRGRPPKAKPTEELPSPTADDTNNDTPSEPPKKKRGRPPKAKTATKATTAKKAAATPADSDATDTPAPTKRRGRPPKAKPNKDDLTTSAPETIEPPTTPSADASTAIAADAAPKKRRGRPAKKQAPTPTEPTEDTASAQATVATTTAAETTASNAALEAPSPTRPRARAHKPRATGGPHYTLDFGWIKDKAKPGSWRRGYGYHKSGQVRNLAPTPEGANAQVKGNYQDHYETNLVFNPDGVDVNCTCPLEETWCKHAVAVALSASDKGLWHQHFGIELPDYKVSENIVGTAELYMGSYRIFISDGRKPNKISIKIQERQTGRLVKQIEPLLMQILELQTQHNYTFNDATQREINLLKLLYQLGFMFTKDGWYHVPMNHADTLFEQLALLEEVCNPQLERVVFEQESLELHMAVNVSLAGNVLVSVYWVKPNNDPNQPGDVLPMEEVRLFSANGLYGIRRNKLYRLSHPVHRLPKRLVKTTFTDIRDADGGKFIYEELPRLRKLVTYLDEADIVKQLELAKRPPQKILNVEMMDPALLKIRVSLDFAYDTVKTAYSKATPKTPYVMVLNKKKETIYWVKRDTRQEKAAYQQLLDSGLTPLQTNYLFAEGDDAIDFFNTALDKLGDEWEFNVKDKEGFSVLKVADHPLKVWAAIDFDTSVDYFRMEMFCRIGDEPMDIDDVREQMLQGKKYFLRPGFGYVEIPLAAILQFSRTLIALEAEKLDDSPNGFDSYRIETFKVGLLQELTEQGVELELSDKFADFWKLITSTSTLEEIPVPDNVNATLRPYQKQGFNWLYFLYTYGLNGILADDMGLGKTLQTLVLLQYAKNNDGQAPSLVVCPSSVVYNWVSEAKKFVPDLKVLKLTGNNRTPLYKQIKDADIVVTSYSLMRRDILALKGYTFRHVILDESQNIKNHTAQTAKAAKQLQCNHRLALSGTPIENRLLELWSVFDYLMPKFLYDIDEFRYRFVTPIEEKGHIDAERRLKKQVFPFILRRLKQDVAKDLPAKIENVQYCELTDAQQELYLDVLERTREEVLAKAAGASTVGKNANSIFAALVRLRQICCHPQLLLSKETGDDSGFPLDPKLVAAAAAESGKFEAMKSMMREIIAEGHRVLFYSQFVEMLKLVRRWLETEGINYEYLTGETPSDKRGPKVDRFNEDESIPVFLISLKAGGTGLNLTGADYVLLYDPWWNPAAENQAADRAHRIGQTKTVMVYRMVTKGTVEEKIMKLKDQKQNLVDSIISADRSMGKLLSFEDLKDILTPDF